MTKMDKCQNLLILNFFNDQEKRRLIMSYAMKTMIIISVVAVIVSTSALAYIDPGTGSIIAGSIWPIIVAFFSAVGAFLIKYFWHPIKNFFRMLFMKKK